MIVGTKENIAKITKVYSSSDVILMLRGKTGSGKSYLARWIHEQSKGKQAPFVHLNAASIPSSLIESELFGHAKGSFSGAQADYPGKIKLAQRGTLFLDEIGELSLELQAKLLTFLDTKCFYPVGSNKETIFSGSIIFASHKNLEELVESGKFREDLYYRLRTFQIYIQGLNENKAKLKYYLKRFLVEANKKYQKDIILSDEVNSILESYDWPGNLRELKGTLEYIVAMSCEHVARSEDLPNWLNKREGSNRLLFTQSDDSYRAALEEFEKRFFNQALRDRHGRINQTAREIGVSKTTLIAKTRKYGIKSAASSL